MDTMSKIFKIFPLITFLFLFAVTTALASASLSVSSIGSVSTTPFYNEWWYTSENPTIQGTAVAGASVNIDVDGASSTVTASDAGTWSFYPTLLTTGDHAITIASGAESLTFTLHIGSTMPTSTATTAQPATGSAELLQAGMGTTTLMLLALGLLITTTGATLAFKYSR